MGSFTFFTKKFYSFFCNFALVAAFFLSFSIGSTFSAQKNAEYHIEDIEWSFEGMFGVFDTAQLQRGFQVYKDVCSSCHTAKFVSFQSLTNTTGPAFSEEQVKAFMSDYYVIDEDTNEERTAKLSDTFSRSFNSMGNPPDLSLIAKARVGFEGPFGLGINRFLRGIGGPEYIYAILNGYTGEEHEMSGTILYENKVFPGGMIAMAPPLSKGLVSYPDATEATVDQMSRDVIAFLTWAAEPKMVERKRAGFKSLIMLSVLAVLLWFSYKIVWASNYNKSGKNSD